MSKNQSPKADVDAAIEKLKSKDKIGMVGQGLSVGLGAAGGAAAASTIAGVAGATTLFGSSALASALGGVFLVTTPVGWFVGCAAAAGLVGLGVSKMVYSGGKQDRIRHEIGDRLRVGASSNRASSNKGNDVEETQSIIALAVEEKRIPAAQAERMLTVISSGEMTSETARNLLNALFGRDVFRDAHANQRKDSLASTEQQKPKMKTHSLSGKERGSSSRRKEKGG